MFALPIYCHYLWYAAYFFYVFQWELWQTVNLLSFQTYAKSPKDGPVPMILIDKI